MLLHKDLGPQHAHVPYFKTYPSSAERLADSSLSPEDEGKLARQMSDNTLWMLVDWETPSWVAIGGSGGGSELPEGAVYTTSTYEDPADELGYGEWELLKIDFEEAEQVSGGSKTYVGDDTVITALSSTNLEVIQEIPEAEYLLIGGGGGGGSYGGGGAGRVLRGTFAQLTVGTKPVVIGAGGAGAGASNTYGVAGGNSSFNGLTAEGGGRGGGTAGGAGGNGGSGGGGSYNGGVGGSSVGAEGNKGGGGGGNAATRFGGGGGGGAGGEGGSSANVANTSAGDGGIGIASDISGTTKWYAGGGGGYLHDGTGVAGLGGSGVGGNGGKTATAVGLTSPAPNTGSGGGGKGSTANGTVSAAGSAGILILRFSTVYSWRVAFWRRVA